jgi:putative membrane protein
MKNIKLSSFLVAGALCLGSFAFAEEQNRSGAAAGADQPAGAAASDQNRTGADAAAAQDQDRAQPAAASDRAGRNAAQKTPEECFAIGAASGGMKEVQAAKIALQKSQRPEVKEFAQKLIDEHQQANQRLKQIIQSKQIQLPQGGMKASDQACVQELAEASGEQFDKAFVIDAVADHVKAVLKFKDASQSLQDPELKAFAAETLPKLQAHLEQAQQLAGWDQATTAGAKIRGEGAGSSTTDRDANRTGAASPEGSRKSSDPAGTGTDTGAKEKPESN